jgi:hypothetical protein
MTASGTSGSNSCSGLTDVPSSISFSKIGNAGSVTAISTMLGTPTAIIPQQGAR